MWRVLVRQFGGRANRVGPPNFGADPFYPFCINKADKFAVAYAYETGASPQYGGNSETIAYDANGNITSLTRTGARAETLAYTYTSGTNRLWTLKSNGSSKTFPVQRRSKRSAYFVFLTLFSRSWTRSSKSARTFM